VNWQSCALGLVLGMAGANIAAASVDKGETVHKEKGCDACHGERGISAVPDQFPHVAGQYASYLAHALRGYRDGTRRHAVMNPIAAELSDEDIRALATFYAAQSGLVTAPRMRPGRVLSPAAR
jgi:cytochrome c553